MADNNATGQQEVRVDKEAMVKVLARYPGTFDVLRELIQNADDAGARSVQVHFQTKEHEESQPASDLDVSKVDVHKWVILNDGNGFGEEDWKRLGKIAHGNDDSMKVGAFRVGFYTVLSKSDRPLVRSNGKSLQFYTRKDGRLSKFPADCPMDSWTSIELDLRKPEPLPMLADLTRFLVSSIAFLTHIDTFVVHLDSQRVLQVEKQVESPADISIPKHLKPTTPQEALTVASIQRTVQRITINAVESAFPPSSTSTPLPITAEDLPERRIDAYRLNRLFQGVHGILKDNTIMHDLYTATINVNLGPESEMMRGVETNMKRLPSDFECKAVYFNSEQYESLVGIRNSDIPKAKHFARLLFGSQGIIPENDSGRLFIGQSTSQTTGIGLHISAHFLPTMERGSIDLANGQVAAWNKDVLFVGGLLARVIYEREMQMHATISKGDLAKELGLCTMARFPFGLTVPHGEVSKILQDAFFSCCHRPKSPFPVVSDVGISCASDPQFRQPFRQNNRAPPFLKTYVVFHKDIEPRQRSEIIKRYDVPGFKFQDIVQEFRSGVTQDALRSFFVWWEDFNRNPPSSTSSTAREDFCQEFVSQGILHASHGMKIALKDIKYFTFLPLPNDLSPPDTIHVDLTSGLRNKSAIECFGWTQLPLLHWLEYSCSQAPRLASSDGSDQASDVGYRILRILVQFALVEDFQQWDEAAELMKGLKCIPTNMKLQLPANSYFEVADVCGSLPVTDYAEFDNIPPTPVAVERGFKYKLLERLHVGNVLLRIGVRAAMDWNDMIERLETVASGLSNYRLLRFLATIRNENLTEQEINDLQTKRVFYSENHGRAPGAELYLPNEDMRKLRLPILVLSQEAMTALRRLGSVDPSNQCEVEKVIESLGIREYPTLDKVIALAASDELVVRPPALKYFLLNLEKRYNDYKPENFAKHAFIPTKCRSYARLNEVFASPTWKKLGFKQPHEDVGRYHSRLGIKENLSVDTIIECFKDPQRRPSDIDTATIWFENLHLHGKFPIPKLREQLSTIPFVPVKNLDPLSSESSPIKYICPKDCLITSNGMKRQHRDIFPFVSFGQHGNGFLDDCRAKKSPDASDIVSKILENPQGYLKALRNNTNHYLEDLRTIASQPDLISEDDKRKMKKAPMFPAFRNGEPADELLPAERVPISDWAGRDFVGDVFVAYQDDTLKKIYREMGSEFLGTCVRHVVTIGDTAGCSPPFNHDEVIRRIGHFMDKRDKNERRDVSFCDEGSTNKLSVKGCNSLTLEQIFTPPNRVDAAATIRTKPVQKNAGFEFGETDGSYTFWIVSGSSESPSDLHYDIAVALCHVLLKTYEPDHVFFMTSLFAMNDELLERYYPSETKPSSAREANVNPKNNLKKESKNEVAAHAEGDIIYGTMCQSTALENIKYFTFLSLPTDLSSPDTIHVELTQGSPTGDDIERFGWTRLPLLHWLEYACSQARQIALDEESTLDVGYRISRVLIQFALVDDLSPQQWDRAAEFLKDLQCIPTNMGLKSPTDSYFEEADVCGSLPVVNLDLFLDIPVTPVADERGPRSKSVTLEHIRGVLAHIRVCRMTEWEDGLGHNLHNLCAQASDLTDHVIREGRDPVARGGFADIYGGLLHSNGESIRVAIKAIRTYSASDGDFTKDQKRLRREIKVWLNLKHINVLPFLGTITGFGRFPAIVCPWVENGPLTYFLQKYHNDLSAFEILTLLNDVASGVRYLHSRSVVHGDLSGSNVLIGKSGRAHICDFGLSTLLTELSGSTFATSTRAGGTIRWAAPELVNPCVSGEEPLNVRPTLSSDVYSFGCVMLQILTGKMPYHHLPYDGQVVFAVSTGRTPPRPACDLVTERQWAFIQRCWSTVDAANSRPSGEEILDFTESEIAESNAFKLVESQIFAGMRFELSEIDPDVIGAE